MDGRAMDRDRTEAQACFGKYPRSPAPCDGQDELMARKPSIGIVAASMALLAMQAAPLEAAGERSEVNPIASATINISMSVAPRYRLRSSNPSRASGTIVAGSPRFCLDSNAAPGLLPVRLLHFAGSSTWAAETAVTRGEAATTSFIIPCSVRHRHPEVGAPLSSQPQGAQVMMIQPE